MAKNDGKIFPITRKVNLIIVVSLIVGIGISISYFAFNQNRSIARTNQTSLHHQSDILYQAIKNAMLPGEAPIAVTLFTDIRNIDPAYDIALYRTSGVEAFTDNQTIATVNGNLGREMFQTHANVANPLVDRSEPFSRSVTQRRNILYQSSTEGDYFFTIYKPLLNLPKCTRCHGSDHTIRGVIRITSDITPLTRRLHLNVFISIAVFAITVLVLAFILTGFMHGTVINPIKQIGHVCSLVTKGTFTSRVTIPNRDEIGILGRTVNEMVEGLYERFQLSKFVSDSTLQSIRDRERGASVKVTLLFSDVRQFTAYTEKHNAEDVVGFLNRILNAQTDVIQKCNGDVDKYVGDEVVALFSGDRQEIDACRAALQIQREVARRKADFDGLQVGIGINTGEVILGMIGSEKRADFTVIGDHVNIASRLCSVAKPGQVIISDRTFAGVRKNVRAAGPYQVRVKGKQAKQRVYLLRGSRTGQASPRGAGTEGGGTGEI